MANPQLLAYIRLLLPPSAESTSVLAAAFERRTLQKGATVLKEGEICTAFYFVESGYLRTFCTKDGVEINLHFHLEGAMTSDHRNGKAGLASECTIAAGEKSEVWVLDRKTLEALCNSHPDILVFGRRLLTRLLLDLSVHSNLSRMYSPEERYRYIEQNSPELLQRVSLSHLASYLVMHRRTLTRIRGKK